MAIKIHDLRECADVLEIRAPKWLARLPACFQPFDMLPYGAIHAKLDESFYSIEVLRSDPLRRSQLQSSQLHRQSEIVPPYNAQICQRIFDCLPFRSMTRRNALNTIEDGHCPCDLKLILGRWSATLPESLFLKALTEGLPMIRPRAVDICRRMMVRYSVMYGVTL